MLFLSLLIIVIKSSWVISLFINASDSLLSMVFNLILANIIVLFFLFCIVFNNFFAILVEIKNTRLKLALADPTGAPITFLNDVTEMLPLVADEIMTYQNSQKKQYIC